MKLLWLLLFCFISIAQETDLDEHRTKNTYIGTLAKIKEKKFIRFLTSRSSFNYYIKGQKDPNTGRILKGGEVGGIDHAIAEKFTEDLNAKLGLKHGDLMIRFELIPVDKDQIIPMINGGFADIALANLTVTESRAKKIQFTNHFLKTKEIVLRHRDAPALSSVQDLDGKTIAVRKSSSHFESLQKVALENGIHFTVVFLKEVFETEHNLKF